MHMIDKLCIEKYDLMEANQKLLKENESLKAKNRVLTKRFNRLYRRYALLRRTLLGDKNVF